jgi:aryl-alcohol dehydrogenase-like predicted oxidoreductase
MVTGKYRPGEDAPSGTRAADPDQNAIIMDLYWTEENKERGQKLVKLARKLNISAAQLAIAWCLVRPEVTSVIIGATRVEQVHENLAAAEIEIPDEILEQLEALYPPVSSVPTA